MTEIETLPERRNWDMTPRTKKRVLVVDRPRIGGMISRMLMKDFETDVVPDALEAVNSLRSRSPAAIIADMDIPGDGIRLTELVGMSPRYRSVPVILTGTNPSAERVMRARKAGASSYLVKPFGPHDLHERMEAALSPEPHALHGDEIGSKVLARVREIEGLPALPTTYAEIVELSEDPDASIDEVAEKIQLDPGLLATVFKLANASCFGFRNRIDSIKLAVTMLGLSEIANLVVSVQVYERLGKSKDTAGMDIRGLWKHSVGTAFIARGLAQWLQVEDESAYLAGMLHDLGKLVMDQHFRYYYAAVLDRMGSGRESYVEAEQEVLGVTHADVGGQLAIEWKLPEGIQDAMLYHHQPDTSCRYERLVCLVHLADAICHILEYGGSSGNGKPEIDGDVRKRFSIGGSFLKGLLRTARQDLEQADQFLAALRG